MKIKVDYYYLCSIYRCYGSRHLHEFLLIEALKELYKGKNYFDFLDVKEYSLCSQETHWVDTMRDLADFGVVVDATKAFTTKGKRKKNTVWKNNCILKGYEKLLDSYPAKGSMLTLDVDQFLKHDKIKQFDYEMYATLLNQFDDKAVMTREFITEITGKCRNTQKSIEKKLEGILTVQPKYRILDHDDYYTDKNDNRREVGSDVPVFPAYVDPEYGVMITRKEKSNAVVKQIGNKFKIKKDYKHSMLNMEFINKELKIKNNKSEDSSLETIDVNSGTTEEEVISESSVSDFDTDGFLLLDENGGKHFQNCISTNRMDIVGWSKFNRMFGKYPSQTYTLSANGELKHINKALIDRE